MVLTVSREQIQLPPGSEVTLRYQTWTDYEALLASRRDDAAVKIRFNAHTQEISLRAPLAGHGNRSRTLAELVTALLRHQNRDWHGFDPVTLKRLRQAGAEPDACFYIENWQAILGKERIDLATDPPPDLAIEMDLTITDGFGNLPNPGGAGGVDLSAGGVRGVCLGLGGLRGPRR
jgi:Uma2 family endonuclease